MFRLTLLLLLSAFSVLKAQTFTDTLIYNQALALEEVVQIPAISQATSCPDTLKIQIPPGNRVSSIDLRYRLKTNGGLNGTSPAQVYSYLECSSKGQKELQVVQGQSVLQGTTEIFARNGLYLANGLVGSGELAFILHAFELKSTPGNCDTLGSKVEAGSLQIVVHHFPDTTSCRVYTAPFFEDFNSAYWQAGQGPLNRYNQLHKCWHRPSSNNPNLGVGQGGTSTLFTGPRS